MPIATHCRPNGVLGTNEIPVSNVSAATVQTFTPSGAKRGAVCSFQGFPVNWLSIPPVLPPDSSVLFFNSYVTTFKNLLVADGWVFINLPHPEHFNQFVGNQAIMNDVTSDTGNGSRFLAMTSRWYDHIIDYIHFTYGATFPIVPFGISWAGWHALQFAATRQSSIVAMAAHAPVTVLTNVAPPFTGISFNAINTTGLDAGQHLLDSVTIPTMVGYGTNDEAVGWQVTASAPGSTPINSNTDAIITNAAAHGSPITRYSTTDLHEFKSVDATAFANWFASTVDPLCPAVF